MWPHRWQPTRLPRPWDSPGKNTGVGFHVLLQCMKVKSQSEVAQLCPTLSDPMDCSLSGSSILGIFQARVLEWGAIAFSEIDLYLILFVFLVFHCINITSPPLISTHISLQPLLLQSILWQHLSSEMSTHRHDCNFRICPWNTWLCWNTCLSKFLQISFFIKCHRDV